MSRDAEKLAIEGGAKVREPAWPARRLLGEAEKQAVVDLLEECIRKRRPIHYQQEQEEGFCGAVAELLGGGFADGVNSGTNAIYVALRALELEEGAEVIVPPITDPGGAMPVALAGLVPVVADAAPGSFNTSAVEIERRLTDRTAAIIVAHISGIPAEMGAIVELAESRGIPVIEDCAQAWGATCDGRPVGTFGTAAIFSTMSGKHICTGGQGGLVYTRDESLYWRIRRIADRGKPFGLDASAGNVAAALNCNMDELHAAIGRAQLRKLPEIVSRRRGFAREVERGCCERSAAVRMMGDPPWGEASYWFLLFRLDLGRVKVDKRQFVRALAAEGVPFEPSYFHCPAAALWYRERGWSRGPLVEVLPNIMSTDRCHFRLMIHEDLARQEAEDAVTAIEKVERKYGK